MTSTRTMHRRPGHRGRGDSDHGARSGGVGPAARDLPRRRRTAQTWPPRLQSPTRRRRTRSRSPTSPGCPATRARRTRRSTTSTSPASSALDDDFTYSFNHPKDDTIVGSSEVLAIRRVPGHAARDRRRLPLRERPGPADDAVRHVLDDDAAQRREPGARPVAARQRVPLHLRGVRRLSLRRDRTASTSRPASSCRTSACGATTTSTTGRTSRRTSRRTRRGSSTACASRSFPSDKLKIEPWLINGWQSYGKFNHAPGVGGQILWRPNGSVSILSQPVLRHRHARQSRIASASTPTTASW